MLQSNGFAFGVPLCAGLLSHTVCVCHVSRVTLRAEFTEKLCFALCEWKLMRWPQKLIEHFNPISIEVISMPTHAANIVIWIMPRHGRVYQSCARTASLMAGRSIFHCFAKCSIKIKDGCLKSMAADDVDGDARSSFQMK